MKDHKAAGKDIAGLLLKIDLESLVEFYLQKYMENSTNE